MKKLILFSLLFISALFLQNCGNNMSPDTYDRLDAGISVTTGFLLNEPPTDSISCYTLKQVFVNGKEIQHDSSFFKVPTLGNDKRGFARHYGFYYNRVN